MRDLLREAGCYAFLETIAKILFLSHQLGFRDPMKQRLAIIMPRIYVYVPIMSVIAMPVVLWDDRVFQAVVMSFIILCLIIAFAFVIAAHGRGPNWQPRILAPTGRAVLSSTVLVSLLGMLLSAIQPATQPLLLFVHVAFEVSFFSVLLILTAWLVFILLVDTIVLLRAGATA